MQKTVRAKFQVNYIERSEIAPDNARVHLSAITNEDSEENKAFWKATPAGSAQLYITNPEAIEFFKEGQSYYLDFTKVETAES